MAHIFKPNCKCPKSKKCTCGATWSYIVDVGTDPITGRRKQKKKGGFRTQADAKVAVALLLVEKSQGTYVAEKSITFEDFSKDWLNSYQSTGKVKISTVRVRQHEIGRLLPCFGQLKIKDITKKQYQDALYDLKDSYATNTLDGVHRTGRMIFKKAVELDIIKLDPTQFAHVPKNQKTVDELEQEEATVKYLEKEELALFLRTASEQGLDRDYLIFKLLAYTGMRAGELCALKWKDIDFNENTLSISRTYYNPTNNTMEYQLLTPKTQSAKRTIEVDQELLSELDSYRKQQKKIRMKYRDSYHDKDFVFAQIDRNPGYPIYLKVIQNRMVRLLKLAGLNQKLTPHSFRHTHTSLLAETGVALQDIMDRLGHKDDSTTKNVYLHVTKPKKKEASHKFSELMRSL